jgi:hypothetical protein
MLLQSNQLPSLVGPDSICRKEERKNGHCAEDAAAIAREKDRSGCERNCKYTAHPSGEVIPNNEEKAFDIRRGMTVQGRL